jgi:MerR family transcriptional regulator, copper efflux regulator
MKIQELAKKHGVSAAAIRHYERLGLFDERHVKRGPNGYREFNDEADARLFLICGGQAAGFSLRELAAGLRQWESDSLSGEEKRAIFTAQVDRIDRQIEQLKGTRAYIVNKLRHL